MKKIMFGLCATFMFIKSLCAMENPLDIHVFYASDEEYSIPTTVSIASMLYNSTENERLHINVVDTGMSEQSKNNIEILKHQIRDFDLNWMSFDMSRLDQFVTNKNLPHTVDVKIFAYELFPDLDRVLWLDGDTIIDKNIRELWEIDLTDKCVAGFVCFSKDVNTFINKIDIRNEKGFSALVLDNKFQYFNGGVILYNLNQIKKLNLIGIIEEYIEIFKIFKAKYMKNISGVILPGINEMLQSFLRRYGSYDLEERFNYRFIHPKNKSNNALILHYEGPNKPWKTSIDIYNKNKRGMESAYFYNLWHEYCNITPYVGLKEQLNEESYIQIKPTYHSLTSKLIEDIIRIHNEKK